ncbi:hypothetical protein ACLFLT_25130 [Klebsiella pneumoniae]
MMRKMTGTLLATLLLRPPPAAARYPLVTVMISGGFESGAGKAGPGVERNRQQPRGDRWPVDGKNAAGDP